jgi:hypothetical protein
MPTVKETKKAEDNIKGLRLWNRYIKQRGYFEQNPGHPSLEFTVWDKKHGIWSFKITNKYRVKLIKNSCSEYTTVDVGDYHRPKQ